MNFVCKIFIMLSFLSVSSFAMDTEDFGLRNRKYKAEKPIILGNSSSSNKVQCFFNELPDEVVILIFDSSDFIGKCSAITSCQRFYKIFADKKPFDISWASSKISQWKMSPSRTLPILMEAELTELSDLKIGQLIAYCQKSPCHEVNTTRDCDRYNRNEEENIKYAYIVLKLSKLKNNFSPEKCQKAQEILKSTSEPGGQAIPGQSGLGFGLIGSIVLGKLAYHYCGGGVVGAIGGVVCFAISFPAITAPLLAMEYYGGNFRENFCAADVKELLKDLAAESDDGAASYDSDDE